MHEFAWPWTSEMDIMFIIYIVCDFMNFRVFCFPLQYSSQNAKISDGTATQVRPFPRLVAM